MRVLFVYKYLTLGGVEAVLRTRLEELDAWGIEAHAWFFHDYGGRKMFAAVSPDRVQVGDIQACADFVRRRAFDVVSSIDTEEILPVFAGEIDLPKLVVEAHSAYPPSLKYLSALAKLHPSAVFVPSVYHGSKVRDRVGPGVDIRVVPNPVHSLFLSEPVSRGASPPRPVIAWVGRLDDFKNWQAFLDIAGSLLRQGRALEAWIVGRPVGPGGGEELIREAKGAGVLEVLRWYRGLPHSAMPSLFDSVRDSGGAVVTTSRDESFGLTIAEAMARRCPVVVPNGGPFREFVEHEQSGLCYELLSSLESVTEQVARFLTDRPLRERCGERARDMIVANYSPSRVIGLLASELSRVARWQETEAREGRLPAGPPRWKPLGSSGYPR